jgi:hypothetical protein
MAELIGISYQRLFEVRLLHHFWLDDGSLLFDTLPDSRKNTLLRNYDMRSFMEISPTPTTKSKIKSLKGVFKNTSLGFTIAVPKTMVIADDEVFTFTMTVTDAAFYRYSSLTLVNHKIHELYYPAEDRIVRYKENIPVFSNLTGVSRGANPNKSLFLSGEIPVPSVTDKVEFLNLSGGALVQLASSQPGADMIQISSVATNSPVFVHQNDTPVIVPLLGVGGTPEKGVMLTDDIPDKISGIINIAATNPVDPDFSCTSSGSAKSTCPVFQIRFKNRSAYWKYLNKSSGAPISETGKPLPLTYNGNAGVKRKPGESIVKIQFKDNDPTKRIEKIYTEIFE